MSKTPIEDTHRARRVTVRDVARRAGVAISSVSRVVNNAPTVADEVRSRVLAAIDELGWVPSVAAQSMRGLSAQIVGFIFSDIRNPLYSAMVKGAEDILSESGYLLMVASSDGSPAREVALLDLFRRRDADGVIFSVEDETNGEVIRSVATSGMPIVLLEREMQGVTHAVGVDHFEGTRAAAAHLLTIGHRRIALITGGRGNRVARDRLAGFERAHADAGVGVDPDLLRIDSFATDYAFRETQVLMEMADPPTAIAALGMHILPGVLSALRLAKYSIPAEVSVIASNDSELAQLATPSITVIRYDAYALGREAGKLLLRLLSEEALPNDTRIQLSTDLILRDSSAPPRTGPLKRQHP